MRAARLALWLLPCAVTMAVSLSAQQPAPPQQQPPKPVFETKTELVLVDVNVVDRDSE